MRWNLFKALRMAATVTALAYLVLTGLSWASLVVATLVGITYLVNQCSSWKPRGLVAYDYGPDAPQTIGALLGTRIDTSWVRCPRIAAHFFTESGGLRSGWFCAKHTKEQKEFRRD